MISIIMPVYNSEMFLRRAIESILNQTYSDIELIIVDDGSTDSSLSIINEYVRNDQRIHVISQVNSGVSAARNAGIAAASGEWLYFMDSDDYIDACFFQDILLYSESYDMIITGVHKHYLNRKAQDNTIVPPNIEVSNEIKYGEFLEKTIKDRNQDLIYFYVWNRVIRSSIVIDNNIRYAENIPLGEDFLFICDLLDHSIRVKTVTKAYYHYNIHSDTSLVGKFYKNDLERRKIIFQRVIDLYKHYSAYNQCKKQLEIREGRASYISLNKINAVSCDLTDKEKKEYIGGFLKERRKHIYMYLAQLGGNKNRLMRMAVLTGNASLVYWMLSGKKRT